MEDKVYIDTGGLGKMTLWERFRESLPYWCRPLKHCQGAHCYVSTANRKDGLPYCRSCETEHNELRQRIGPQGIM